MTNNRGIGSDYEAKAALYLQKRGYEIVEHNFQCRFGEIDLVARHRGYLVFVEVKYRKNEKYGSPMEAVDYQKQRKISKVAQYYVMKHRIDSQVPIRFDVVAILGGDVEIYENAFLFVR